MFKDISAMKTQLAELAEVINMFKSEAVQLRVLDMLFCRTESKTSAEAYKEHSHQSAKIDTEKKDSVKKKRKRSSSSNPKKSSSKLGAKAAVSRLVNENFFKEAKTLNDIISHCDTAFATKIKPNEISGKMARLVRDGILKRKKNESGQYEYIEK